MRTLAPALVALLVAGSAPVTAASLIPTSTTFSLPDGPISMGAATELRATVSPDPGSGTVGFFVNNVLWASGAVGPSGIAVAAVPDGIPWLGDIPVYAWFEGNDTYAPSDTRPAVTVTVIDTRP